MIAPSKRFGRSTTIGPVPSWRDSASQQAQYDLDRLVNEALPLAQETLDKSGEFYPYGVAVALDGATRMIAGDPGEGEHPASTDVIATMLEGLTRTRDELRAIAIAADVRTSASDAIRVELEHRDGHAIAVLLPYKKKRFRRGIEYGSLSAAASTRRVWGQS